MDEVKEQVTITVNEEKNNSIMDYDYSLDGNSSVVTETLNFVLDAIIITCSKNCNIRIKFFEIDINVVDIIDLQQGSHYIPIRIEAKNFKNERFNFNSEKMLINNKLEISTEGPNDIVVNVTLRCKDA